MSGGYGRVCAGSSVLRPSLYFSLQFSCTIYVNTTAKLEVLTGHIPCSDLLAWLFGAKPIFVCILLLGCWFLVMLLWVVVLWYNTSEAFDSISSRNSTASVDCYNVR